MIVGLEVFKMLELEAWLGPLVSLHEISMFLWVSHM